MLVRDQGAGRPADRSRLECKQVNDPAAARGARVARSLGILLLDEDGASGTPVLDEEGVSGKPGNSHYFGMFQSFSMIFVSMASPWHVPHSMSSLLARESLYWYSSSMNVCRAFLSLRFRTCSFPA